MKIKRSILVLSALAVLSGSLGADSHGLNQPPKGFTALFKGKDLSGWHGMNTFDMRKVWAMSDSEYADWKEKSIKDINQHWSVENRLLINDGHGLFWTTDKEYKDIELWVDYKTVPKADSGIYLRGNPQVQIWDPTEEAKWNIGSDKGSGGLWNNSKGAPGKDPLVKADNPFGEWNRFHIIQMGDRTTVSLNGKLVVDHATMENYFNRKKPLWPHGPVQLQTHGAEIHWRNVFIREIPSEEANARLQQHGEGYFETVFNGRDFSGWAGPVDNYEISEGAIGCKPKSGGTIYYDKELTDFVAQLEFKLPPGGNNGLAIRYPGKGDTAYGGMCELQVLDDSAEKYAKLDARQYHGSAYGMVAAHRGYQRSVGAWNFQQVTVKGSTIKVELNGYTILDTDLSKVSEYMGGKPHQGKDRKSGYFGFAGHGDAVQFRNIRIMELK